MPPPQFFPLFSLGAKASKYYVSIAFWGVRSSWDGTTYHCFAHKGLDWWLWGAQIQGFCFAAHPAYDIAPARGSVLTRRHKGLDWWLWGAQIQGFRFAAHPAYDIAPARGSVLTRRSHSNLGCRAPVDRGNGLLVRNAYILCGDEDVPTPIGRTA